MMVIMIMMIMMMKLHNILTHLLFVKALGLVSPCLHALTSFSASHEIASILNTDFCQFFSH